MSDWPRNKIIWERQIVMGVRWYGNMGVGIGVCTKGLHDSHRIVDSDGCEMV